MSWLVEKVRNQKGALSVAELLTTLAIFCIIISALFAFLVQGSDIFVFSDRQIEAQRGARIALKWLTKDIRVARTVTIENESNDEGSKLTLGGVTRIGGDIGDVVYGLEDDPKHPGTKRFYRDAEGTKEVLATHVRNYDVNPDTPIFTEILGQGENDLVINNGTYVINGRKEYSSVTINGGTLTHNTEAGYDPGAGAGTGIEGMEIVVTGGAPIRVAVELVVDRDLNQTPRQYRVKSEISSMAKAPSTFTLNGGGRIDVTGKGYIEGPGYSGGSRAGWGGSGHGSSGGDCGQYSDEKFGGGTYGSENEPDCMGSGKGGGRVKIEADVINIYGSIQANGESNGASGGSIWLVGREVNVYSYLSAAGAGGQSGYSIQDGDNGYNGVGGTGGRGRTWNMSAGGGGWYHNGGRGGGLGEAGPGGTGGVWYPEGGGWSESGQGGGNSAGGGGARSKYVFAGRWRYFSGQGGGGAGRIAIHYNTYNGGGSRGSDGYYGPTGSEDIGPYGYFVYLSE